ncbi:MAG: right-handed parallel beta-helix repeat-containing protein [Candidatus Sumerlaeota bacterium]
MRLPRLTLGVLMLSCAAANAGSLTPPGAPASTMRSLADISPGVTIDALPFTITQSGVYTLSRDLVGKAGSDGITVSAPNVTLDLNGYSLRGTNGAIIGIVVGSVANVTIKNGSIGGWGGDGIHAPTCTNLRIQSMSIRNCTGDGIEASNPEMIATSCDDNGGYGARLVAAALLGSGRISSGSGKSSFNGNASGGIFMDSSMPVRMEGIDVTGNTGNGVTMSSSVQGQKAKAWMVNNFISRNTGDGLHISLTHDNGECDITITDGDCDDNGGDGINVTKSYVGGRFALELNGARCNSNSGSGFVLGADSDCDSLIVNESSMSNNGAAGMACAGRVRAARLGYSIWCDNASYGVSYGDGSPGSVGTSGSHWEMRACTLVNNGDDGVQIFSRGPRQTLSIDGTFASNNDGDGFLISPEGAGSSLTLEMVNSSASNNSGCGAKAIVKAIAVSSPSSARVSGSTFDGNGEDGIQLACDVQGASLSLEMVNSSASNNALCGGKAINTKPLTGMSNRYADCVFNGNGEDGIQISSDGDSSILKLEMVKSSASNNGGSGAKAINTKPLTSTANRFDDCEFNRNGENGVIVSSDGDSSLLSLEMVDSTASNNILAGGKQIGVTGHSNYRNRFSGCVFNDNGTDGISATIDGPDCAFGTSVEGTTINDNGGMGLRAEATSSDKFAQVRGFKVDIARNAGGGVHTSVEGTACDLDVSLSEVTVTKNALFGWSGDCSGAGKARIAMTGSTFSGNSGDGMNLDCAAATTFAVLLNTDGTDCDDNDEDGIQITGGNNNAGRVSASMKDTSATRNGAAGGRATGTAAWILLGSRFCDNGGDGVNVAAESCSSTDNEMSGNGGAGMIMVCAKGGVIHRDIAARNALLGVSITGNDFDVSECVISGHRSTSGVPIEGMRTVSANAFHHNSFINNDIGLHLVSGSSTVFSNSARNNGSALVQDPGVTADVGPITTAAGALSVSSNIGF